MPDKVVKKVGSIDELRRMALRRGLTIEHPDGKKFNEDRLKVKAAPTVKKAEPVKKVSTPALDKIAGVLDRFAVGVQKMADSISAKDRNIESVLSDLRQAMLTDAEERRAHRSIDAVIATKSRPSSWIFDLRYNNEGRLVQLVAKASRD